MEEGGRKVEVEKSCYGEKQVESGGEEGPTKNFLQSRQLLDLSMVMFITQFYVVANSHLSVCHSFLSA